MSSCRSNFRQISQKNTLPGKESGQRYGSKGSKCFLEGDHIDMTLMRTLIVDLHTDLNLLNMDLNRDWETNSEHVLDSIGIQRRASAPIANQQLLPDPSVSLPAGPDPRSRSRLMSPSRNSSCRRASRRRQGLTHPWHSLHQAANSSLQICRSNVQEP